MESTPNIESLNQYISACLSLIQEPQFFTIMKLVDKKYKKKVNGVLKSIQLAIDSNASLATFKVPLNDIINFDIDILRANLLRNVRRIDPLTDIQLPSTAPKKWQNSFQSAQNKYQKLLNDLESFELSDDFFNTINADLNKYTIAHEKCISLMNGQSISPIPASSLSRIQTRSQLKGQESGNINDNTKIKQEKKTKKMKPLTK